MAAGGCRSRWCPPAGRWRRRSGGVGGSRVPRRACRLLSVHAGRPTPLTPARRLSAELGVTLLLKREDLTHTGSHKINNVLGQALLARRMGSKRLIAETGAGMHGVATATAGALLGLPVTVFMGERDIDGRRSTCSGCGCWAPRWCRSAPAAARSRTPPARPCATGSASTDEAYYCVGSVIGPHPYPWMVREFQRVIGDEARRQCAAELPTARARLRGRLRRRRLQRGGHVRRVRRHVGTAGRRRGRGRRRCAPRRARRAARLPVAVPPGRARPDPGGALDRRRARLSRASGPSTRTCATSAAPAT